MKKHAFSSLYLLLILFCVLAGARAAVRQQTPTDKTVITFVGQPGQYVYSISAAGAATQLSNATVPDEQLLQFARDLALAARGELILGPDGLTLVPVATGTLPTPNPLISALLAKSISQVTASDGTTVLFPFR